MFGSQVRGAVAGRRGDPKKLAEEAGHILSGQGDQRRAHTHACFVGCDTIDFELYLRVEH